MKHYINPQADVISYTAADIISTSGGVSILNHSASGYDKSIGGFSDLVSEIDNIG